MPSLAGCKVDNGPKKELRAVLMPPALVKLIEGECSGSREFSSIVRACCWAMLGGRYARTCREVVLTPAGDSSVDQLMEWLLARQPLLADIVDGSGEISPELRRYLRRALPQTQGRRLLMRLGGMSLEEIGLREGCTKQAVHNTLKRADDKLRRDIEFVRVLVNVIDPERELGLSPELLFKVVNS